NLPVTLEVLRPGGVVATYASMGAPEPAVPFYPFMQRNALFRLVFVYEMGPDAFAAAIADITRWLASGTARHLIAERHPLARLAAAHESVESGAAIGNVIVD